MSNNLVYLGTGTCLLALGGLYLYDKRQEERIQEYRRITESLSCKIDTMNKLISENTNYLDNTVTVLSSGILGRGGNNKWIEQK